MWVGVIHIVTVLEQNLKCIDGRLPPEGRARGMHRRYWHAVSNGDSGRGRGIAIATVHWSRWNPLVRNMSTISAWSSRAASCKAVCSPSYEHRLLSPKPGSVMYASYLERYGSTPLKSPFAAAAMKSSYPCLSTSRRVSRGLWYMMVLDWFHLLVALASCISGRVKWCWYVVGQVLFG